MSDGHWWVRAPWWVRGMVSGLFFATAMFAWSWGTDDDSDPTGNLLGAVVGGLLFGLLMGLFVRSQERRVFHGDGHVLTTDERVAVVRSVDAGRWPDDPGLHPVAARLVEQRLRDAKPAVQIVIFGLLLVMALVNVVISGPWWLLAVAFGLVMAPLSIRASRRRRASAQALRDAAPAGRSH